MNRLIPIGLSVALVLLTGGPGQGEEQPRSKILFLGKNPDHPYGSHMYLHTCGMLARCVELTPGLEAIVSNGWPKDARMLQGVKTIVVYTSPAAELLLEGPQRAQVDELMKKGVGLVTIHWASSIYKDNFDRLGPTWLSYLGGTWVSNVGLSGGKSTLKQLIKDHPICRGWSEFEIEDEYYLHPVLKQAKPLLQVKERKGTDVIVGWVYERPDGGRSFGTTLGHPYKNFQIEAFRRMIVNAILWSAHVEVPREGAPVNLSPEALALPEKNDVKPDAGAAADQQKMQGTWVVVSAVKDGRRNEQRLGAKVVYKGDTFQRLMPNANARGTFKLEPGPKVKRMDITYLEGPEKGQTWAGIYSLEGDVLKLCYAAVGKPRPSEFTSTEGSQQLLILLRREPGGK